MILTLSYVICRTLPELEKWLLPHNHAKSWVNKGLEIVVPSVGGLLEIELSWLVAPETEKLITVTLPPQSEMKPRLFWHNQTSENKMRENAFSSQWRTIAQLYIYFYGFWSSQLMPFHYYLLSVVHLVVYTSPMRASQRLLKTWCLIKFGLSTWKLFWLRCNTVSWSGDG